MATIIRLNGAGASGSAGSGSTPTALAISFVSSTGQVSVAYSATLFAAGGVTPYTFSISSGALPPGLSLNTASGAITGTPTTAGTYTFGGRVTDFATTTATITRSITVVSLDATDSATIDSVVADPGRNVRPAKLRTQVTPTRSIEIKYTPPSPLGAFAGTYVQIEAPDQSAADSTPLDGSVALNGATSLAGPKEPLSFGPFAHSDVDGSIRVAIDEPHPLPMACRARLISYSAGIVNDAATAPTMTFTVAAETTAKRDAATAHTANATISIPATTPDGDPNPFTAVEGGILMTHLWVHQDAPLDSRWIGSQWVVQDESGTTINASGVEPGADFELVFKTPTSVQVCTVYAPGAAVIRGTDGVAINPIVPGITPSATVTLGTNAGTLHLGHAILDSVTSALGIIDSVLGVVDGGITESLIDTFAVSSSKIAAGAIATGHIQSGAVTNPKIGNFAVDSAQIANAAVTNAKIGALAVDTAQIANAAITTAKITNLAVTNALINDLAATKITAGTLAAGVIYGGTINATQLNAGTVTVALDLTASRISLNSNGITTSINNNTGAGSALPAGVSIQDNSTLTYTEATANGFFVADSSNFVRAYLQLVGTGASCRIVDTGGVGSVQMQIFGGHGRILIDGSKVLGPRVALTPSTLSDVIFILQSHSLCN